MLNDDENNLTDDDYFNMLADDAYTDEESNETDDDAKDDDSMFPEDSSNDNKLKYKHKLNKPLLFVGCIMIAVVFFMNKTGNKVSPSDDNLHVNIPEDYTTTEYISVKDMETTESSDSSIIEIEQTEEESDYIQPVEGEHLTNLPVVVTDEIDAYFKDSVSMLKVALSVDTFIANNTIYDDEAMIKALSKLVDDYKKKLKTFRDKEVPEGCDDFYNLVIESLDSYEYYFIEVIEATNESSEDEFNNSVKASISFVETKMSGLKNSSDTWEPVFVYYGLFE